jgi:hypothetical protein
MSDGRFWRVHWYRRGREFCNPCYDKRLRATSPDVILHPQFGKRQEVRENGMLQIEANEDLYQIDHAELYVELWGGHPGTVNKRVSVNGRSTYVLPEVGTKAGHCTYVYPRIDLKITDLVNGFNAFQWAVDNETFWGNLLLDNAALRVRLKPDHPAIQVRFRPYIFRGSMLPMMKTATRWAAIGTVSPSIGNRWRGYRRSGIRACFPHRQAWRFGPRYGSKTTRNWSTSLRPQRGW